MSENLRQLVDGDLWVVFVRILSLDKSPVLIFLAATKGRQLRDPPRVIFHTTSSNILAPVGGS